MDSLFRAEASDHKATGDEAGRERSRDTGANECRSAKSFGRDGGTPPCILDVVHQEAAEQTGGWPFSLVLNDEQLEKQANSGLFRASVPEPSAGGVAGIGAPFSFAVVSTRTT